VFTVVITEKEGAERRLTFSESEVTVGRVPGNDVVLPKGNVSKRHSRIVRKDNRFIVVDLKSTNGTYVNGRKITSPLVVKEGDKIYVGDFVLTLESEAGMSVPAEAMRPPSFIPSEPSPEQLRARTQLQLPAVTSGVGEVAPRPTPQPEPMPAVLREPTEARPLGDAISEPEPPPNTTVGPSEELLAHAARRARPSYASGQQPLPPSSEPARPRPLTPPPPVPSAARGGAPELRTLLRSAAQELTRQAQLVSHDESLRRVELERVLGAKVAELLVQGALPRGLDRAALVDAALRELGGLGPLEALLANPAVAHVVVERFDRIYADAGEGLALEEGLAFSTPESLLLTVRRLLAQADVTPPLAASYDVVLPSGLHLVCFLGATTDGPVVSLKRRIARSTRLADLESAGWLDGSQHAAISSALGQQRNVWVVGPDSALLARVLCALVGELPAHERLALCERSPEIAFEGRSVVCLRLGTGPLGELLERARSARVRRLCLHNLREEDLKPALASLAKGGAGHLASYETSSTDQLLLQLRRAGGVDLTLRAVGVLVSVVADGNGGGRVASVSALELNDSSELVLVSC
jgi:pilus assembly protein CpaF